MKVLKLDLPLAQLEIIAEMQRIINNMQFALDEKIDEMDDYIVNFNLAEIEGI